MATPNGVFPGFSFPACERYGSSVHLVAGKQKGVRLFLQHKNGAVLPKASTLWKISTATSPESEEAIVAVLEALFGSAPSIYTDAQTNRSVAEVYLQNKPSLALLAELKLRINAIRGMGLPVPRIGLRLQRLKRRDWAESWKAHFKPIEI